MKRLFIAACVLALLFSVLGLRQAMTLQRERERTYWYSNQLHEVISLAHTNWNAMSVNYEIGLRDDGVVVWRKK